MASKVKKTKLTHMLHRNHGIFVKVHIFLVGHKILQNLHQLFDWQYIGQMIGGDFAKY